MKLPQTNKEKYRLLCKECSDIPLFMQAWWMDAVCENDKKLWDVILVEINDKIIGALPYHIFKKYGFKIVTQPQLTQYNGVWINYPRVQSSSERYSYEKLIMSEIAAEILKMNINMFSQSFHYNVTNWQPFYWFGFNQTTRYTYLIDDISNPAVVYQKFHIGKQKHIKKAQQKLVIDKDLMPDVFYDFLSNSLKKKNNTVFYNKQFFLKLYECTIANNQGKIIGIRDSEQNIHSAMFVVWDANAAYYLISAIDPDYRSSGASSLMVWEAICYLSDKTKSFDFEGSMIEGVAKANEEFGAIQMPYSMISKEYTQFKYLFKLGLYLKTKLRTG